MLKTNKIKSLPSATGVYLFKKGDEILYIGKTISLKARILSHFENAKLDPKESLIISKSNKLEYIQTDSEFKAILLESALIQKFQPKYNSRWKDDKSYLYIKITIKDVYPKIFIVRKESDNKSLYYGPFPSKRDVQKILSVIRKLFPFCQQKKISKFPCFYSKINLCDPCPNKISHLFNRKDALKLKKIYRKNVFSVKSILEGKTDIILKHLYQDLSLLTKKQKFEEAIILRNRILHFETLIKQTQFSSDISNHYNLSKKANGRLLDLLNQNNLKVKNLYRIEGYDISSLFQKDATASMVVFTDGLPDKSQYKRFRIKSKTIKSDFEMLEEVFVRRFKQNWKKPDLIIVDGGTPQVLKVINTLRVRKSTNTLPEGGSIPIIGIAKRPDRLVLGASNNLITIRPSLNNLGFNLVKSVRDEAHRFARKYHLLLRSKRMMI